MNSIICVIVVISFCFLVGQASPAATASDLATTTIANEFAMDSSGIGRKLVEQGRTLVHHAFKRFMIILPAIFFKLGVAFTLLVLVTLVTVNNGFIGFLLLVVGLSSVLARLQEPRRPVATSVAVPYYSPAAAISSAHHHHNVWDRSDSSDAAATAINPQIQQVEASSMAYGGYASPVQYSHPAYYAKYAAVPSQV